MRTKREREKESEIQKRRKESKKTGEERIKS